MESIVLGQETSKSTVEVFEFIRARKIVRFHDLVTGTGLSKRTLLYSIRTLREMGLIETQICMNDTRRRFYCLRIPEA